MDPSIITDAMIQQKAYELWEARGRPDASPEIDWYAAEAALRQAVPPPSTENAGISSSPAAAPQPPAAPAAPKKAGRAGKRYGLREI